MYIFGKKGRNMIVSKLPSITLLMLLALFGGCGGGGGGDNSGGNSNPPATTPAPAAPSTPATPVAVTPTRIAITPAIETVTRGDHVAFTAVATYADGHTEDVTSQSTWTSSDTSIATLDAAGDATTQAQGSPEIEAACKGVHSEKSPILVIDHATLQGIFVDTAGPMGTARQEHTGTLLTNGQVLVAGGHSGATTNHISAELFNPASGLFSPTGDMTAARYAHTATLLGNKKVLVTGGYNGAEVAGADLYDSLSGKFTATGNLNVPRHYHTATLLRNGKILVTGGSGAAGFLDSAELYDPATGKFTSTGSMSVPRRTHTATLLKSGKVLVTGGQNGAIFLDRAEVYDPDTGHFTPANPMGAARVQHVAALLPNGKVLVAGGFGGTSGVPIYHASAELYDPSANGFSPTTNSMSSARWLQHSSTLQLAGGKILITGGRNGGAGSTMLTSADIYNPTTGLFSPTGNLLVARQYHSATLLLNGKVLVAGGMSPTGTAAINTAELYQ